MGIFNLAKRCGAVLIGILHTRAELAAVELEEEYTRLAVLLILTLCAMFFFALALLLTVGLAWMLFEEHRLTVLAVSAITSTLAGIGLALATRTHYRAKPRLLQATLNELAEDYRQLCARES